MLLLSIVLVTITLLQSILEDWRGLTRLLSNEKKGTFVFTYTVIHDDIICNIK